MKKEKLSKQITDLSRKYSDYTAENLSQMVKIPSLSGEEKEVVLAIQKMCEDAGFDDIFIDGLGNLVATIGSGDKILAIDAHIDTVDVGNRDNWEFDPFSGNVDDKFVYGRGTVDQEGGAASMITAGRILKELGFDRDWKIYFTFTVMEEDCDGLCWQYLIEKENVKPDIVLITEPTNLGIYRGHRGRMEMEVYVNGVSAHGSAPERGKNAIYAGSRIALAVEKLHDNLTYDPFLGKGSITATLFQSDSPSLCAVSDYVRIHLDRRLTWGETKESSMAEIEKIISKEDARMEVPMYDSPSYKGTVFETEKYYPTWRFEANHPVVRLADTAYRQLFDDAPNIDKWTFSTNGVTTAGRYNIPTIGFGPGNEVLAHAPNEKTPRIHLDNAAAFYAMFAYCVEME